MLSAGADSGQQAGDEGALAEGYEVEDAVEVGGAEQGGRGVMVRGT